MQRKGCKPTRERAKEADKKEQQQRDGIREYIFSAFLAVFFLVFQLIFSSSIQDLDARVIKAIQSLSSRQMHDSTFFKVCVTFLYYYTEFNVVNGALCFLYSAFNPFISFKVALLANVAIYIHSIAILLIYKEPKPYWVKDGIYTTDCESVFTGPSYNQFMATLVIFYSITVFRRYQIIGQRWMGIVLVSVFVYLNLMTLAFSILNAHHFIYQNLLGIIIAAIIVVSTNVLDNTISLLSLRLGFFIKSSKKYKFLFLVILLLVFALCMAFTEVVESNTFAACPNSKNEILKAYDNTKIHLTSAAFIIGMCFGAPFSNESMPLNWWKTPLKFRLLRGFISVVVYTAIVVAFSYIPYSDFETKLMFHFLIPKAINSFVSYGLLPLLYNKIKLTQGEEDFEPEPDNQLKLQ